MQKYFLTVALLVLISVAPIAQAQQVNSSNPQVVDFIERMIGEHGFDRTQLQTLFSAAEFQPRIIELMTKPAESKPWYQYKDILITQQRIALGKEFMREHSEALRRAEEAFGVPKELVVAIIGVETNYGSYMGSYRVIDALATLAFNYPPRSAFFTKELEEFLILTREQGASPTTLKGSYAGAMGYGQFMPSSFRHYAVDFDADGKIDIWRNPVDAIGSVANYFKVHGWKSGDLIVAQAVIKNPEVTALAVKSRSDLTPQRTLADFIALGAAPKDAEHEPRQPATLIGLENPDNTEFWIGLHNFYVITRYNQSALYAMAVHQLSQKIAG